MDLKKASDSELLSEQVFDGMKERVDANLEKVKAINGVFVYNITKGGKVQGTWTLDLKKCSVYKGEPEKGVKVDATVTIDDQDMVDLALGKLNPQAAFMKGKLKVKGNIMLIQKLKILMSLDSKL
uniref:SCP2 domain-containing protein n=1 Tax=Clastoptera arizonana TaxID=38151 RepID=A0A1B6D6F1_9HEMI